MSPPKRKPPVDRKYGSELPGREEKGKLLSYTPALDPIEKASVAVLYALAFAILVATVGGAICLFASLVL